MHINCTSAVRLPTSSRQSIGAPLASESTAGPWRAVLIQAVRADQHGKPLLSATPGTLPASDFARAYATECSEYDARLVAEGRVHRLILHTSPTRSLLVTRAPAGRARVLTVLRNTIRDVLGTDPALLAGDFSPFTLVEDLGADVLRLAEIGMALEESFGIEVTDADLDALAPCGGDGGVTTGDLIVLVERKLAEMAAA